MKRIAILAAALAVAATPPTDRPYVMAHTSQPLPALITCVKAQFDHGGAGDVTPTDYGTKLDYRYGNLGGTVKSPTMTLEAHNDGTLVLYGFGTWKGATGNSWKHLAKKCFPDAAGAKVAKP